MEIYKITNLINNKIYIGQTTRNMKERMSEHIRHHKIPIDKDIFKYGINNFKIEVIDTANNQKELDEKEIKYIHEYDCMIPKGYNLTLGGRTTKGYKHTQEAKKKMSIEKSKAYTGNGNPFFGKKHTDKSKVKMSEKRKGMKHLTEEQINRLRASHVTVKVICIETGEIFNSIKEASEKYNIFATHITRVCKGKKKSCGGYHWKYYNS